MPQFIVETSARHVHVTQQDLEQAAAGRKSSIVKSDIDQLRQFAKEWDITLPDEL